MTYHIGTDIVEIDRIRQTVDRWGERFLRRVFTDEEIKQYGNSTPSLAARFTSKEAVMKLLGAGMDGIGWRDIETLSLPGGKPTVRLYGRAKSIAENQGIKEIEVSLAHSKDYAIATAIGGSGLD